MQNPIVRKLGILAEDTNLNILILRPDGSIVVAMSGLAMDGRVKDNVLQNVIESNDEKMVDDALARKDLDEAKRLAFAHAPLKDPTPKGKKKKKSDKISIPHLRSRAKVYLAMGKFEAAQADIQEVFLKVNTVAGYISMRTDELEEAEALKATISTALKKQR
jgi:hypothetical protein